MEDAIHDEVHSINPSDDTGLGSNTRSNDDAPTIKRPKRKIIIEPLLCIVALTTFPMMILTQQYIVSKITTDKTNKEYTNVTNIHNNTADNDSLCNANKSSPEYIFQQEVQAAASQFNIYSTLAYATPSLVMTVLLGSYSDKVGRKYAIIPPLIGSMISTLSYILVILLDLPLWYLIIGSLLNGFGGSFTTLLMGCFAYIADITDVKQRQFRIAIVELIMFMSAIFGPLGVGVWISEMGYTPPLIFVLCGDVVAVIYVIFLVPETVIKQPDAKFLCTENLKKTVLLFMKDDGSDRRWKLCTILLSFVVIGSVGIGRGIDTLFEMNSPLCWGSAMLGYFSAAYIGVATLGGITAAKVLKFCVSDNIIAILSGLSSVCNFVYVGFVINTLMMFGSVIFGPLKVLFMPTIRALMSKLVGPTEQGSVFGAIAFAELICMVVGTVTQNLIYSSTLSIHTGFVYFYNALIYAIGTIILVVYVIRVNLKSRNTYKHLVPEESGINGDA